jgi:arylsulfatase
VETAAVQAPPAGTRRLDQCELFHVADHSESTDLTEQYPGKIEALIRARFDEADKNLVSTFVTGL